MDEKMEGIYTQAVKSTEQAAELIGRLFRLAEPGAVFGAPITQGERTIIVASELSVGMGVGFGAGGTAGVEGATDAAAAPGAGSGGGGGGFAMGRPVAAVVIEPAGVRVEPIVDPTKLGIAFFTTLGAMFLAWSQMRRAARR